MKKKIIEKLELPYDDGKGNFSSGSGEIHILRKINEIIDYLNQSQKQPEGETIQNYNPEKGWDRYKKSKIEVKEFNLVPKVKSEKQEEWKWGIQEALEKDFEKLYVKEYTTGWKEQRYLRNIEIGIMGFDNLERFISQLLSERTREVLEDLQKEFSEYGVPDDVRYTHPLFYINNIIGEKLSKLSKKKNE
ncbi:MAG TPA: hypothetical protein PKI16_03490 [Candidatus Dojkabacteria bacterium]|nr:hypothetical protein [Candidatus Dojkabacteria bacterium]